MLPRLYQKRLLAIVGVLIVVVFWISFRSSWTPYTCHNSNCYCKKNRNIPLIFIGGSPRSGTTLMRALLDSHSMIRCGEETVIIPRLLPLAKVGVKEKRRYNEAGISYEMIQDVIGTSILTVIEEHGKWAPILCNKDPMTMMEGHILADLFPQSKLIFMVRDGRAVVNSMIQRKVAVSGFNLTDYAQCLVKWNKLVHIMNIECEKVGEARCLKVYYERLILQPRKTMKQILQFVSVQWEEAVLHHNEFIGSEISVSKLEKSSDQIALPINTKPLTEWVKTFPANLYDSIDRLAPMISQFGYDSKAFPPNYGPAEGLVENNTKMIELNKEYWRYVQQKVVARPI